MTRERETDQRELAQAVRHPPKFEPGRVVATPGALESVPRGEMMAALDRHSRGDWGECCQEDADANDRALEEGARLMSVYGTKAGTKFWIITEADRSATTVLLPEDY